MHGPIAESSKVDHHFVHSTLRESIVEHLFVGDLLRYMWLHSAYKIEVLKPAIDVHGYDLAMNLGGVTRHIQLKTLTKAAKRSHFNIHSMLAAKESGCVIVINVDPENLTLGPYLFFGGDPGEPLPSIHAFPESKHAKANSRGEKTYRANHHNVPKSAFRCLNTIDEIVQVLFGVRGTVSEGMTPPVAESIHPYLFDYLPQAKIIAALTRSPGNELAGKFMSPESSAALAANTFGFFLEQPHRFPPIPHAADFGRSVIQVGIECCAPFPWWPSGRHPWLDAMIETDTHLIGIESKRYEPYRPKALGAFQQAYWRPVWGTQMKPYETMRDRLKDGTINFDWLDAVQLTKHAFGLRTQASKRQKSAALIYLYAEPYAWPDGRPVSAEAKRAHVLEAERFTHEVSGAEVAFRTCTYRELLAGLRQTGDAELSHHADMIAQKFHP
jgi:hypothetical protein